MGNTHTNLGHLQCNECSESPREVEEEESKESAVRHSGRIDRWPKLDISALAESIRKPALMNAYRKKG